MGWVLFHEPLAFDNRTRHHPTTACHALARCGRMRLSEGLYVRLVAISLVVCLFAPCLRAEQATGDSAARRQLADKGMRKITIGIVLLTAGVYGSDYERVRGAEGTGTDHRDTVDRRRHRRYGRRPARSRARRAAVSNCQWRGRFENDRADFTKLVNRRGVRMIMRSMGSLRLPTAFTRFANEDRRPHE